MKIYDITYGLSGGMAIYEGDPPFGRKVILDLKKGDKATVSVLTIGSHNGTHFDAPSHMIRNGATIDRIDPSLFLGKARVVRIRHPDAVTVEELKKMNLKGTGKILFKTRNSDLLRSGRPFTRKFVHLTAESADFLGRLGVRVVGIDYLSVDRFRSGDHPAHMALLRHGILILETIDLSRVPPGTYDFFAAPLLVKDGDGAPARVFLVDRGGGRKR